MKLIMTTLGGGFLHYEKCVAVGFVLVICFCIGGESMLGSGAILRCIPCNFSGSGVGSGFSCFLNFLVKISDIFCSAAIVSSPMVENGTSGHRDGDVSNHLSYLGRPLGCDQLKTFEALENCEEKLECIDDSLACCCRNVHILTPIMVHGRAKGPSWLVMSGPCAPL
jgi:hypothetical protein